MLARHLAQNLAVLRQKHRMTLARLARASGISVRYIADIEQGCANPSLTIVECLAVALCVDPLYLLSKNEEWK